MFCKNIVNDKQFHKTDELFNWFGRTASEQNIFIPANHWFIAGSDISVIVCWGILMANHISLNLTTWVAVVELFMHQRRGMIWQMHFIFF